MAKEIEHLSGEEIVYIDLRNPKDILMWGYYGESGNGVCVGHTFDDIISSTSSVYKGIILYGNIKYSNNRPKINYYYRGGLLRGIPFIKYLRMIVLQILFNCINNEF